MTGPSTERFVLDKPPKALSKHELPHRTTPPESRSVFDLQVLLLDAAGPNCGGGAQDQSDAGREPSKENPRRAHAWSVFSNRERAASEKKARNKLKRNTTKLTHPREEKTHTAYRMNAGIWGLEDGEGGDRSRSVVFFVVVVVVFLLEYLGSVDEAHNVWPPFLFWQARRLR